MAQLSGAAQGDGQAAIPDTGRNGMGCCFRFGCAEKPAQTGFGVGNPYVVERSRRLPDGLTVIAGHVQVRRAPRVRERDEGTAGCCRKRGLRGGKDRIRQDCVAEIAWTSRAAGRRPRWISRRDRSRDGSCRGDAQLSALVCGNVPKIHMVECLPRKQAGLAVSTGFVPVGQGLLVDDDGERGMLDGGMFNGRGFHG